MSAPTSIQRGIPSVDQILQQESFRELERQYSRKLVRTEIQRYLDEIRDAISKGEIDTGELNTRLASLPVVIAERLDSLLSPSLRKVVNASGVILHTNIGRAPLAPQVLDAVRDVVCSYSNLEYDLAEGRRSQRDKHFESRITRLLGCPAATVVNNNAAAVFLILNTLASRRDVLVSRGELIEIGGSFRIPDIMVRSGAILREVGTTNKTTLEDYAQVLDDAVGLILRVHPSNYKIIGFTERPKLRDLVALARQRGIPLVKDAGSGYLFPLTHPALRNEPSVHSALNDGADLVCFSGDKLLGGPQAGIIVGRADLVERIRRNPLMRVCRVDKFTYATLDWVLAEYEKGTYQESVPVFQMLMRTEGEIRIRAEQLGVRLSSLGFVTEVIEGVSLVGGGSAPGETMPTALLSVTSVRHQAARLESWLRNSKPPVLSRVEDDRLLLDLRTVFESEEEAIFGAFSSLVHAAEADQ